jgi:NADPH-dependent 2,4-dienoyl-CoA reductase/sulfur reductase-like enzyme
MKASRVAVVGAGPAGLAVAEALRAAGAAFDVFDENPRPGGNITRHKADAPPAPLERLIDGTADRFIGGGSVLGIEDGPRVTFERGRGIEAWRCDAVFLCAGAYDGQLPRPGLRRPGVTTAGALQALLKGQGLVPRGPVVLAGAGPFLHAVAADLLDAGAEVSAIVDRVPWRTYAALLPRALGRGGMGPFARAKLRLRLKGVGVDYGAELRVIEPGSAVLADGRRLAFAHLGISDFFAPQTQLARSAGCAVAWSPRGRYFHVVADELGRTGRAGIYVCGEGQGVRGAEHATLSGTLAVHAWLEDRGKPAPLPPALLARRARVVAFAEALERAMQAREPIPPDEAWACACERTTVGAVRGAIAWGLEDMSSLKSVTRLGMGSCQGRYCEPLAGRLMAEAGRTPRAALAQKGFVRPVTARLLADA